MIGRWLARRLLVLVRGRGGRCTGCCWSARFAEAIDVYTAVTRVPGAGLVPVGIHLTEGYAPSRAADAPVPVFAGRDVLSLVRELRRRHDRGLRLGQRPSRASCAGWPGSSRAPASTSWSRRS